MKNIIKYSTVLIALCMALLSCSDKKPKEESEEQKSETEVALTEEQYKTVGIELGIIEQRNLHTIVKANGYTTVPPQNAANVSTLIGGVVKDIYVLEGTYVAKGKVLATLQNLDVVQMQEDYNSAVANIEYLQLEYNRQKTLSEQEVNPRKVFQEIKSKLEVEKAKAKAAEIKLKAINVQPNSKDALIPILSPISGYVGKIHVTKGAYVQTGVTMFDVVDNSQMHLDLNVYEKDLGSISIGQEVDFVLTNQSNKTIKGKIFGINKSFSNESKSVAVHAKIVSGDTAGLISGMYVSANINIVDNTVPALPKDAVVKNGDKFFIFTLAENHSEHAHVSNSENQKPQNHEVYFNVVEVVPGTTDMGYTEVKVIQTLPANAQIVTKGAFYLLSVLKGAGSHQH